MVEYFKKLILKIFLVSQIEKAMQQTVLRSTNPGLGLIYKYYF